MPLENMYEYIIERKIELPGSIVHRLPGKLQEQAVIKEGHLLDELLEAIKMLIDKADKEIVGRGSVKKGNRIEGWIDRLDIPVIELGILNLGNRMSKEAIGLYKSYNREVAILLERTNKLSQVDRMQEIKEKIELIREEFLLKLGKYSAEERRNIILAISYEIYKSSSAVHDSILWINNKEVTKVTASEMIHILSEIGEAYQVKKNGCVKREQVKPTQRIVEDVRFWCKERIDI